MIIEGLDFDMEFVQGVGKNKIIDRLVPEFFKVA